MKKIKIGIFGSKGRMGESIIEQIDDYRELQLSSLCENKKHSIVGKELAGILVHSNLAKLVDESDVIIDFTIPEATINLLEELRKSKKKNSSCNWNNWIYKKSGKKVSKAM